MNETVTASYTSIDQARNAEEELIADGMPREKIYIDEATKKIRVITPQASRPGIVELLAKHGLSPIQPQPQV